MSENTGKHTRFVSHLITAASMLICATKQRTFSRQQYRRYVLISLHALVTIHTHTCYDMFNRQFLKTIEKLVQKGTTMAKNAKDDFSRWKRKEGTSVGGENWRENTKEGERESCKAAVASSHPHGRRASLLLNSLYWLSASRTGTSARRWLVSPRASDTRRALRPIIAAKSLRTHPRPIHLVSQFHLSFLTNDDVRRNTFTLYKSANHTLKEMVRSRGVITRQNFLSCSLF